MDESGGRGQDARSHTGSHLFTHYSQLFTHYSHAIHTLFATIRALFAHYSHTIRAGSHRFAPVHTRVLCVVWGRSRMTLRQVVWRTIEHRLQSARGAHDVSHSGIRASGCLLRVNLVRSAASERFSVFIQHENYTRTVMSDRVR